MIITDLFNYNLPGIIKTAINKYFADNEFYEISCINYSDDNKIINRFLLSEAGQSYFLLDKKENIRSFYKFNSIALLDFLIWILNDCLNDFPENMYDLFSSILFTLDIELI